MKRKMRKPGGRWCIGLLALSACAADSSAISMADDASGAAASVLADEAGAPSGGASSQPVAYEDPALQCYRFTAYASPSAKTEKYSVPTTPDLYVGFNIKAPWPGTQYIKSIRSVIDNAKVVHHWQLYRNLNGGSEGIFTNDNTLHPDAELLYGFAPGTDDLYFDRDVGMAVPAGSVFQLENHYNNRTGSPVRDGSGLEICVTPTKPAHVAAMSFVGSLFINGTGATGTCTHASKEPVHLIMGFPHMHLKGIHMKVDWTHADGSVQTIHDRPFDFNYQRTYMFRDVVLQPGDKLTTTCTYSEPARVGKRTTDEMCYFFSVHWPAGALTRRNAFAAMQGPNTCMD